MFVGNPYVYALTSVNSYTGNGVKLNGVSQRYERNSNFSGAADGKQLTAIFAARFDASGNNQAVLIQDDGDVRVYCDLNATPDELTVKLRLRSPGGTIICDLSNSNPYTVVYSSTWIQCGLSVDMADPAKRHMVINGVDQNLNVATYVNDTIDMTSPYTFGGTNIETDFLNGCLSDIYIRPAYFNLPSYVSHFWKDGRPTDLEVSGPSGGWAFDGTQPLAYLDGDATNILVNKGSGGNLDNVVSGALIDVTPTW